MQERKLKRAVCLVLTCSKMGNQPSKYDSLKNDENSYQKDLERETRARIERERRKQERKEQDRREQQRKEEEKRRKK